MQADVEHARIFLEAVLRAVAVMHVPVENGDVEPVRVLQIARQDGDVVEQAEAHGRAAFGMVPGRAQECKAVVDVARDQGIGEREGCTGCEQCDIGGCARDGHIGGVDERGIGGARGLHAADVGQAVAAFDLGDVGCRRGDTDELRGPWHAFQRGQRRPYAPAVRDDAGR